MADENKILLEPAKAGQHLVETQNQMKNYINEINMLAEVLKSTAGVTYSAPIAQMMLTLSKSLTDIGHGVNEGVTSYSNAFKDTIEQWKSTDATAAQSVSFDKQAFDGVQVTPPDAVKLDVEPGRLRELMARHQEHGAQMQNHFGSMTQSLDSSKSWAIGQGFDITRNTWQQKLVPLQEQVQKLMGQLHDQLDQEVIAVINRSRNTYVS